MVSRSLPGYVTFRARTLDVAIHVLLVRVINLLASVLTVQWFTCCLTELRTLWSLVTDPLADWIAVIMDSGLIGAGNRRDFIWNDF